MDPGRDPTAGFFSGLIVAGTVNIIGILSDFVPFYTAPEKVTGIEMPGGWHHSEVDD